MPSKHVVYLTPRQRKFLGACEEQDRPIAALLRQHHIARRQLRRWLRSDGFRRRLETLAKAAAALRDLEVQRAAGWAAQRLADAFQPADKDAGAENGTGADKSAGADKGLTEPQRKLCVELIRLARSASSAADPEPPEPPAPRRLTHPSLGDRADAELAELQRLRREDDLLPTA